jgi:ureidoacrylate peracid hydrolase
MGAIDLRERSMMLETPLLIAIDIQREYITPGRPYCLNGVDESLENCRDILAHARARRWQIAHVRHVQPGPLFNENHAATQFVKGFEPLPHEYLFTKNNFSAYSNTGFARFMEHSRPEQVYIIGYNSLMCCLSTIIEGYHRGHELTFVKDASLARATPAANEAEAHVHATHIISFYANVMAADEVMGDVTAGYAFQRAEQPSLSN